MVLWNGSVVLGSDVPVNAMILLPKPSLIHPCVSLRHAAVRVISIFGASPHCNPHEYGKDCEGGLIREQYMFHIVHSPRFAPMKRIWHWHK